MKTMTRIKDKKTAEVTLTRLQQEVALLRSAVISLLGVDSEGEYRPEFVKQTLKAAKAPAIYQFKNAKSFLRQLNTGV